MKNEWDEEKEENPSSHKEKLQIIFTLGQFGPWMKMKKDWKRENWKTFIGT